MQYHGYIRIDNDRIYDVLIYYCLWFIKSGGKFRIDFLRSTLRFLCSIYIDSNISTNSTPRTRLPNYLFIFQPHSIKLCKINLFLMDIYPYLYQYLLFRSNVSKVILKLSNIKIIPSFNENQDKSVHKIKDMHCLIVMTFCYVISIHK